MLEPSPKARALHEQLLQLHGAHIEPNEAAYQQVLAENRQLEVLAWAIQAHGAAGVSGDFALAHLWALQRTLRLADGPDEVHGSSIARMELARYRVAAAVDVTRGC